jgi:hypothetical protein
LLVECFEVVGFLAFVVGGKEVSGFATVDYLDEIVDFLGCGVLQLYYLGDLVTDCALEFYRSGVAVMIDHLE